MFISLGQYDKAKEYLEKALYIKIENGHKEGEATSYGNLESVFQSLGQYDKAKNILRKALPSACKLARKQEKPPRMET